MWLSKLIAGVLIAYFGIVALAFVMQNRMLFPAQLASSQQHHGEGPGDRLELVTPDGVHLKGVHIAAAKEPDKDAPIVLGFGGNAWNGEVAATYLHALYPEHDVVVFHYRGYAPSQGKPTAKDLLSDSLLVFDYIENRFGARPVVGVGFSIGSGVAAHLAANRQLDGLILVTPFDSLRELAVGHFPWLPVRWLFRHDMEPGSELNELSTPVAIIAAENDNIVFPNRTAALRQQVGNLVLDRTIANADHNNIYDRAEFREAMAEAMALMSGNAG